MGTVAVITIDSLFQRFHGFYANFGCQTAVTALGGIFQKTLDGNIFGVPCQLEDQIKEVQADTAQLGAVAKAVAVFHNAGVGHLLSGFNVAGKIPVHVVIAAKFVQRLQHIAGLAQRAVVGIAVHRVTEGGIGLLAVGPQVQHIHFIRHGIHKALHHAGHRPNAGRGVGAHPPSVKENTGFGHQLMHSFIGVLGIVDADVDVIIYGGGNMAFARGRGHKVVHRAVFFDPDFDEGLEESLEHGIFRVQAGLGLGGGVVVLDPLAAKVAGIGIKLVEVLRHLIRRQGDHNVNAQGLCIFNGIADCIAAGDIFGFDLDARHAQLNESHLAGIAVPAVQPVRVDLVAGVFVQFFAALGFVQESAVVIYPLANSVAELECGAFHDGQVIRHGHIGVCFIHIAVPVKTDMEDGLQQVADAVIDRAVIGTAEHQNLTALDNGQAVVFGIALCGQDTGVLVSKVLDQVAGRGAANENAVAGHSHGQRFVRNIQDRSADFFDIITQLFCRMAVQPGSTAAHDDGAGGNSVDGKVKHRGNLRLS